MNVMDGQFWAHVAIYSAMVLVGSVILAYLQPAISQLLSRLFAVTYQPMYAVQSQGTITLKKGLAWSGRQLRSEKGENLWWRVLGSFIGAFLFVLCFLSDMGIVMMTLEAYGFGSSQISLPAEPIWIIGSALLLSGAVWGIFLTDLLNVTSFWAWTEKIQGNARRVSIFFAVFMLLVVASVVASMAAWRSGSLTEAMDADQQISVQEAEGGQLTLGADTAVPATEAPKPEVKLKAEANETGSGDWLVYYPNIGIAVSSFLATAVCITSFIVFLKYLSLALSVLGCLIMAIPVAVLWVLMKLVDAIYWVFEMLLNLLTMPGRGILRLLGVRRDQQQTPPIPEPQMPEQTQTESTTQAGQEKNRTEQPRPAEEAVKDRPMGTVDGGKNDSENHTENSPKRKALATDEAKQEESQVVQSSETDDHQPKAVNYDPFRA